MPRHADTRQRIERTALALFAAKGVDATTTKDIAAGVGISEGAIYRHFAGKDALTWHLFSASFFDLARRIDAVTAETDDLPTALSRTVGLFCDLFDADPDRFAFILLSQHGQLARVTPDMPNPVESLRRLFQAALDRGEATAPTAPANADLLAAMALGLVLQPATYIIYGRLPRPMGALAPAITAAIRRAVTA